MKIKQIKRHVDSILSLNEAVYVFSAGSLKALESCSGFETVGERIKFFFTVLWGAADHYPKKTPELLTIAEVLLNDCVEQINTPDVIAKIFETAAHVSLKGFSVNFDAEHSIVLLGKLVDLSVQAFDVPDAVAGLSKLSINFDDHRDNLINVLRALIEKLLNAEEFHVKGALKFIEAMDALSGDLNLDELNDELDKLHQQLSKNEKQFKEKLELEESQCGNSRYTLFFSTSFDFQDCLEGFQQGSPDNSVIEHNSGSQISNETPDRRLSKKS